VSTVAVTGATGCLGRVLVNAVVAAGHEVVPIGRTWRDDLDADVLLHLAAPDWRDPDAVMAFAPLNERIARWSEQTGTRVVNTATWWQQAGADAERLDYTRMKADQAAMFPTSLVLFSVYGDTYRADRGFIPLLVRHCRGLADIPAASYRRRDWVHVDDVCRAYLSAMTMRPGVYEVATGQAFAPAELVRAMTGRTPAPRVDHPDAAPHYRHPRAPGWVPRIGVLDYLNRAVRRTDQGRTA
jgi:nucleoside-diphosphate-sugar epimerase